MSTRHLFTVVVEQLDAPDPFDDAALLAAAQAFATGLPHTGGHEATLVSCSVAKDTVVQVEAMQHVTDYDLSV
jgi:hypothetical protein